MTASMTAEERWQEHMDDYVNDAGSASERSYRDADTLAALLGLTGLALAEFRNRPAASVVFAAELVALLVGIHLSAEGTKQLAAEVPYEKVNVTHFRFVRMLNWTVIGSAAIGFGLLGRMQRG